MTIPNGPHPAYAASGPAQRAQDRAGCARADTSRATCTEPAGSSWRPDEAVDDPDGVELAWLTGQRRGET